MNSLMLWEPINAYISETPVDEPYYGFFIIGIAM
jgi:hypothetical protein